MAGSQNVKNTLQHYRGGCKVLTFLYSSEQMVTKLRISSENFIASFRGQIAAVSLNFRLKLMSFVYAVTIRSASLETAHASARMSVRPLNILRKYFP